ncbi:MULTISPECIES: ABC transporter ATP-binding protein [unclassified Fusibacter]|uniref:ABC transporter ATP-binding protein n=1 Tax=unclassified Fusibacter TaxID=2624464 RepID=UPI0010104F5E|nr:MULTISPECIES: ABC transporter ATP-binding protein [unclassified Fusibacter]MCK8060219.1 ABC transporter ATP-binding protein [Fusibacter sp. A2]NPE22360.1 ABC transporter ATP-binding protein [Fusibacter sp. A1]RXV61132.1 ABC transporter ATP-binding protein [Fusibacter sp. A1]
MENIVFEAKNLTRVFGHGKDKTIAVDKANFKIMHGKVYSIVGESGSGKTTTARMLLGLLSQSEGELSFFGKKINLKKHKDRVNYWTHVQAVFQDPFSSFNQFYKVQDLLINCLKMKGIKLKKEEEYKKLEEACGYVNLDLKELWNKHPFELSGGQMQRLMIARIFLIHPKVLIADEPTSMIDACSRSTILDMLMKLRDDNDMTIIFITHDIGLSYYVSDEIFIMEEGRIVEQGDARSIIENPTAEYTKHLLTDVPTIHNPWLTELDDLIQNKRTVQGA